MSTPQKTIDEREQKKAAARAWRERNLERVREYDRLAKRKKRALKGSQAYNEEMREYRKQSPEVKIRILLSIAKGRARKRGLEFELSVNDLEIPTHCPLLGIELNYKASGMGGLSNSPSLDRIDTSKGYVPGNVWVISFEANRAKNNLSVEQLEMLAKNLRAKIESQDT